MRSDHRLRRDRQGVIERLVRNVRHVDDHAEAVHFANHLAPESSETVVARLIRRRVAEIVVAEVGQSHRPDAEAMVDSQDRQIAVDLVATFDGQDGGDLPRAGDPLHIGGVERQLDLVGMSVQQLLEGVAQVQGPPHGIRPVVIGRNPESEKRRVNAALAQPRRINVPALLGLAEIDAIDEHPLESVYVSVDTDRLAGKDAADRCGREKQACEGLH